MISPETTPSELAALVVAKLAEHKIDAVLVGGAVVSIYTANRYASQDLDFISPASHARVSEALAELNFHKISKGHGKDFANPNTQYTIEFPSGPIGLGEQCPVVPEGEIEVNGIRIKMLSPTQCVMDRLLNFFHYNDRQSLDQAVWVAQKHPVNEAAIRAWAAREPQPSREAIDEKLKIFFARIEISD